MLTPADEITHARTEALLRGVNERIADIADRLGADDASFVCECGDPDCTDRLRATRDEYGDVRAEGAQFMLVEEHIEPEIEQLVERRRGFAIVAKMKPHARRLVEKMDPRARQR